MNIKQKKFFYGSQRQIKNLREGKPMMGCIAHNGEITSIEGGDEQASEAAASHIEAKPPPPYAQKTVHSNMLENRNINDLSGLNGESIRVFIKILFTAEARRMQRKFRFSVCR